MLPDWALYHNLNIFIYNSCNSTIYIQCLTHSLSKHIQQFETAFVCKTYIAYRLAINRYLFMFSEVGKIWIFDRLNISSSWYTRMIWVTILIIRMYEKLIKSPNQMSTNMCVLFDQWKLVP